MRKGILLLTIATFTTFGLQAKDNGSQQSNTNVSNTQSSASAGPKEDASRLGLTMLDQTNQARTAIQSKNKETALQDIDTAINDLNKARKDESGKIIPLYQEFANVSVIGPVRKEQQTSGTSASANNNSESNNSSNSSNNSATTKPVADTVHQVQGSYSVMEVDTDGSLSHLNAAKTALNNGNWNTADKDLAAVQDGVVFASYQSDLPLVRAQENLILARQSARKGDFREVHAALASSASALSQYEKMGGAHASDAKNLQQQIQSYDQHVMQKHNNAESKIDGWWNTASNWIQNPSTNS